MADQKYVELQKLLEVQLTLKSEARYELLSLYFETLQAQEKNISPELALELIEFEASLGHHELAKKIIHEIHLNEYPKFFNRIARVNIKAADAQGQVDELYLLLSEFLVNQFERHVPHIPGWTFELYEKYFKNDFNLGLKVLALNLMTNDIKKAERCTRDLIACTVEKSSPKAVASRLLAIGEILKTGVNKAELEIYQNFCFISCNGILNKYQYKQIVEMIIFFDDFKFQTLVLNLLHQLKFSDDAKTYATAIRQNPEYNFVYFDKYFLELKQYFIALPEKTKDNVATPILPDLELTEKYKSELIYPLMDVEDVEDEQKYLNLIKYQEYSVDQLLDLAVSFLQSDMPRVALKASEKVIILAKDDSEFLKGCYLKFSCLILTKDFRPALDTCLIALNKATSKDDILSFLYGQAEVYIRLNQGKEAKKILKKIVSIDSKYRLAKERLDKLNEI
jgi:hypothetical protein